jgi:hypothetical protein
MLHSYQLCTSKLTLHGAVDDWGETPSWNGCKLRLHGTRLARVRARRVRQAAGWLQCPLT